MKNEQLLVNFDKNKVKKKGKNTLWIKCRNTFRLSSTTLFELKKIIFDL